MLVYWIPDTVHTLPINATHRVGVGAFVMNDKKEVHIKLNHPLFLIFQHLFGYNHLKIKKLFGHLFLIYIRCGQGATWHVKTCTIHIKIFWCTKHTFFSLNSEEVTCCWSNTWLLCMEEKQVQIFFFINLDFLLNSHFLYFLTLRFLSFLKFFFLFMI